MFSSGLFGSCCSQGWGGADFCLQLRTPAFLKGTGCSAPQARQLAPGHGTASPTPRLAPAEKPEGVRTRSGLVQPWRAGGS